LIENGIEPQETWNDWKDYRDGFRDQGKDKQLIYKNPKTEETIKNNKKIKKLIKRRKQRTKDE
jgi:hypothetical protein